MDLANEFFAHEVPHLGLEPASEKEVASYCREDAFIWSLCLAMRRLDLFLRTHTLRKEYPYMLPGKIRRR